MKELQKKYPIRNTLWNYISETDSFVIEMSVFQHSNKLDPWFRWMPKMDEVVDNEGEVVAWKCSTTVEGNPIKLVIFND